MRKALFLGVFLAVISASIVVAAIVGAKYCNPQRRSNRTFNNPTVGPTSTQSYTFGTYSRKLKDGWNRKQYSSVVIFGASDCDDAHARAQIYAGTFKGSPGYRGRYTNGIVFGEYLAASTLTGHNITLLNYAYGKATISNDLVKTIAPDTRMQMEMYIDDINTGKIQRGDESDGRVLHCIWIGKNDLIEIWNNVITNGTFQNGDANGETSGFESATKNIKAETNAVLDQIKNLMSNPAVNSMKSDYLLMLGQPLEIVPNLYYQAKSLAKNNMTLSKIYLKYVGDIAQTFNENLIEGVTAISKAYKNEKSSLEQDLSYMDIPKYWYNVRDNPASYNFVNVLDACWNSSTGVDCKEPDRWQYYDTLHVSTKMHEYLAQEITVSVNL